VMKDATSPPRNLRFGVFEVDLQTGELRKHGVRVKLQEQPFQILVLLLEQPGAPVTREELRQKLWPAHTFVDFDRSLNKAMTKLRSALGDSAESPRFIETLHRRGYRFLAPVSEHWDDLAEPVREYAHMPEKHSLALGKFDRLAVLSGDTGHTPQSHLRERRRRYYAFATAVCLLVLLGALFILRINHPIVRGGSFADVRPRRSVAVLGFKNLSGDVQESWLSTALSDWLNTELAAGNQLRTISAESVARMKMELSLTDVDSLDRQKLTLIRKNLGTDFVVVGSYAMLNDQSDGEIRLDLRLQNTRNGETVDAISETGTESHLFDLVSRAGQDLRSRLGIQTVTREEAAELATVLPASPQAARFYSEGVDKLRVFDALSARELLLKAVAAEPNYALSHAALSTAWSQLGYDKNAAVEAKKAFDLSSNLPRSERLLVEGRYRETSRDWGKAIEIYSALFEVFPDNLDYGLALASAQGFAGKWQDSLETVAALRQLPLPLRDDPRIDLAENRAAESLGDLSRAEASAARAAEKAQAIDASLLLAKARLAQAWAFENLGELDQVAGVVNQAKQLYVAAHDRRGVADAMTLDAITLEAEGNYLGAKKKYDESLAVFQKMGDELGVAGEYDNIGDIHYYLGDLTEARRSYEQAIASYREIGDQDGVALAQNGLGNVFLSLGEHAQAKAMFSGALAICREIGDRDRAAVSLSGLGGALRIEGNIEGAEQADTQAKATFQAVGDRSEEAQSNLELAEISLDLGKDAQAAASAQRAADTFEQTKAYRDEGASNRVLSVALLAQGRVADAEQSINKAVAAARQSHNRELELSAAITAARVRAASGKQADSVDAAKQIKEVLAEATAAGFGETALDARLALGEIEIRSGNRAAGRARLESLQKDAARGGFLMIAREAAAALRAGRDLAEAHM